MCFVQDRRCVPENATDLGKTDLLGVAVPPIYTAVSGHHVLNHVLRRDRSAAVYFSARQPLAAAASASRVPTPRNTPACVCTTAASGQGLAQVLQHAGTNSTTGSCGSWGTAALKRVLPCGAGHSDTAYTRTTPLPPETMPASTPCRHARVRAPRVHPRPASTWCAGVHSQCMNTTLPGRAFRVHAHEMPHTMVYSRLLLPPLAATLQQHLADRRDALRDEADRRGYQQQGRRRRHRTPPGRRSTRRAASSTSQSRARRVVRT